MIVRSGTAWNGPTQTNERTIQINASEQEWRELCTAISHLLCWMKGYNAGADDKRKYPFNLSLDHIEAFMEEVNDRAELPF